jgi:hypothetical protein
VLRLIADVEKRKREVRDARQDFYTRSAAPAFFYCYHLPAGGPSRLSFLNTFRASASLVLVSLVPLPYLRQTIVLFYIDSCFLREIIFVFFTDCRSTLHLYKDGRSSRAPSTLLFLPSLPFLSGSPVLWADGIMTVVGDERSSSLPTPSLHQIVIAVEMRMIQREFLLFKKSQPKYRCSLDELVLLEPLGILDCHGGSSNSGET